MYTQDEKFMAEGSACCNIVFSNSGNKIKVTSGVLSEESLIVLRDYFRNHYKG